MEWWQAGILAMVEGITEFLPISSTGHMIMAARLMEVEQTEFVKSFEIAIQLGAIAAVAARYTGRLRRNPAEMKTIAAAFGVTGIIGGLGYKLVKTYFLGNLWLTVVTLGIGGIIMVGKDSWFMAKAKDKKIGQLSLGRALGLGAVQAIAMVPGVSRAWVTIWGGLGAGLSRREAAEFSFLLAVPTMAAATGWDLINAGWQFGPREFLMLGGGFAVAMITAWLTVGWFVSKIESEGMTGFGWYRIAAAGSFWLLS